jgi:hypothetical protein
MEEMNLFEEEDELGLVGNGIPCCPWVSILDICVSRYLRKKCTVTSAPIAVKMNFPGGNVRE